MSKKIIRGSGNVFKDIGLRNPEEYRAKAQLALQISKIIERRGLTQAQAAKLIGAAQPDISKLKSGQLGGFTIDRLLDFLRHLDRSIEIHIKSKGSRKEVVSMQMLAAE
jgi:predicted XRE-type DNA-binding protein